MKVKVTKYDAKTKEYKTEWVEQEENIIEEPTQQLLIEQQILEIKQELSETDYKCLKYVDGALSEEEYATVREYRQSLRDKINELEMLL